MIIAPSSPRALLIAPQFFGYEQEIAQALYKSGYAVDLLPDRPFNNSLMKAVMRYRPELGMGRACNHFFAKRIEELGRNNYSIIVIVQGEGITAITLKMLRSAYPKARLVFYTWDSIKNKTFFSQNLSLYDRCSTFDPFDAKKYGMNFRPLFYSDRFNQPFEDNYVYDLSFIGTVHSDRYRIVRTLLDQIPSDKRFYIYLYLQAPWMYDVRRIFTNTVNGAKREDFQFVPLSNDVVRTTFFSSRAILDIEHVNQRGVTMRSIEALGSNRKMVSTNLNLRDYDFYNPKNIVIFDRKAPRLDPEFFLTPYEAVPQEIRQKYSIQEWIREVCGQ